MRWVLILAVVSAYALAENVQLHCVQSQSHTCSKNRHGRFFVDGKKINIKYTEAKLTIKCEGAQILESPGMPQFTNQYIVPVVELVDCHLPEKQSILDVLTTLNVYLQQSSDSEATLSLVNFRAEPKLEARHFTGLQGLQVLELKPEFDLKLTTDVFIGLKYLRVLKTNRVSIISEGYNVTQSSQLVETKLSFSGALQKLQLINLMEKRFTPFGKCEYLLQLDIYRPNVEELPERWIAACPEVQRVTIKSAENLVSVPQKLFEGATNLKRITVTRVMGVQSLPEGFLEGAPNLNVFEWSHGRLKTLSSKVFYGPPLRILSLSSNRLDKNALEAFASLTSLAKLDLSYNADMNDVCDANGYSVLRNLKQLKELNLKQTSITRICRDWREDLTSLKILDMSETEIKELKFEDFQYTRDPSIIEDAEVTLEDASITSIRFSEADYKMASTSPAVVNPIKVIWSYNYLICGCDMYWTRKTLDVVNFTNVFPVGSLLCEDNRYFMAKTLEQICPGRGSA